MNSMTFLELLKEHDIVIPVIQRDYAQGRREERRVREGFVAALKEALTENRTLMLDFIYGEVEDDVFLPFDGQQRLTTLFLLHWYAAARKEAFSPQHDKFRERLRRFRYEVRESSQSFCRELAEHADILRQNASGSEKPSFLITDACWFSPAWNHDPTVTGMLTMLDAIHVSFSDVPCLMERLEAADCPVRFYFARLSKLGNSADDIFITMNARGKHLTAWEHFKAQFLPWIRETYPERADDMARKLDNDWLDVFWTHFAGRSNKEGKDGAAVTDRCFSAFLQYMADLMLALPDKRAADDTDGPTDEDLFSRMTAALSPSRISLCPDKDNMVFLCAVLDALHERILPEGKGIASFFADRFVVASAATMPVAGKISLFSQSGERTDLFRLCCEGRLTHAESFILFACLLMLTESTPAKDAARRLRILRNVLEHSSHEFVPEYKARQLREVHELMVKGRLAEKSRFNSWQIREEKAKENLRNAHEGNTELQESLDYLEDHPLLRGRIAVFSRRSDDSGQNEKNIVFDNGTVIQGRTFFLQAFAVPYDVMVRGLLRFGNYALPVRQRFFFGSQKSADRKELFSSSPDTPHFRRMRKTLQRLMQATENAENLEDAINHMAELWLRRCEQKRRLPWRYYFVKYKAMRPDACDTQGYYAWEMLPKRHFEWLQPLGADLRSQYWSPFLWSVYLAAQQTCPSSLSWETAGKWQRPLLPHDLALWCDEFSWIIGNSEAWDAPLNRTQKRWLHKLHECCPAVDENGVLPIPGVDSDEDDSPRYRLFDATDRIELILPVLQAVSRMK